MYLIINPLFNNVQYVEQINPTKTIAFKVEKDQNCDK